MNILIFCKIQTLKNCIILICLMVPNETKICYVSFTESTRALRNPFLNF